MIIEFSYHNFVPMTMVSRDGRKMNTKIFQVFQFCDDEEDLFYVRTQFNVKSFRTEWRLANIRASLVSIPLVQDELDVVRALEWDANRPENSRKNKFYTTNNLSIRRCSLDCVARDEVFKKKFSLAKPPKVFRG